MEIEQIVYDEIKTTKRVSSGNKLTSEEMAEKMMGTGLFEKCCSLREIMKRR